MRYTLYCYSRAWGDSIARRLNTLEYLFRLGLTFGIGFFGIRHVNDLIILIISHANTNPHKEQHALCSCFVERLKLVLWTLYSSSEFFNLPNHSFHDGSSVYKIYPGEIYIGQPIMSSSKSGNFERRDYPWKVQWKSLLVINLST